MDELFEFIDRLQERSIIPNVTINVEVYFNAGEPEPGEEPSPEIGDDLFMVDTSSKPNNIAKVRDVANIGRDGIGEVYNEDIVAVDLSRGIPTDSKGNAFQYVTELITERDWGEPFVPGWVESEYLVRV